MLTTTLDRTLSHTIWNYIPIQDLVRICCLFVRSDLPQPIAISPICSQLLKNNTGLFLSKSNLRATLQCTQVCPCCLDNHNTTVYGDRNASQAQRTCSHTATSFTLHVYLVYVHPCFPCCCEVADSGPTPSTCHVGSCRELHGPSSYGVGVQG